VLAGKETIILAGSVINSGASIVVFMVPLRKELPDVRVVVAADVVQAKTAERQSIEDQRSMEHSQTSGITLEDTEEEKPTLSHLLKTDTNLTIIALRKSDNKYTGKGTNDTGHRLFNTTNVE
jgi:hypothetical protein